MTKEDKKKRSMFGTGSWGYKESFFIASEVMLLGLLIEVFTKGRGLEPLSWPHNILFIGIFACTLIALHLLFKGRKIIRWLASTPTAISAIVLFALLTMLMGFIPQHDGALPRFYTLLGLTHVTHSWVFALSQIYLLSTLGLVIIRRVWPLNKRNIGFTLNHLGLWIVIVTATAGAGDMKRMRTLLKEKQAQDVVIASDHRTTYKLPFSMELLKFTVEYHHPKLVIVKDGKDIVNQSDKSIFLAKEGAEGEIGNWHIEVLAYYEQAIKRKDTYEPLPYLLAAPAAKVRATNTSTGDTATGWLSTGTIKAPQGTPALKPEYLQLNGECMAVLLKPEPDRYASRLVIHQGNTTDTAMLEVNKPLHIEGYDIYQSSYGVYQEGMVHRHHSILEVVHDPWLPVVYAGFYILLAGAVYLFWIGLDTKKYFDK